MDVPLTITGNKYLMSKKKKKIKKNKSYVAEQSAGWQHCSPSGKWPRMPVFMELYFRGFLFAR
jgi:hypothetical protein